MFHDIPFTAQMMQVFGQFVFLKLHPAFDVADRFKIPIIGRQKVALTPQVHI
jgi:hypothetical protein